MAGMLKSAERNKGFVEAEQMREGEGVMGDEIIISRPKGEFVLEKFLSKIGSDERWLLDPVPNNDLFSQPMEIDVRKVVLEEILRGNERLIFSHERKRRILELRLIRLGPLFLEALLDREEAIPGDWKKLTLGEKPARIIFEGTYFVSRQTGGQYVLGFCWSGRFNKWRAGIIPCAPIDSPENFCLSAMYPVAR